MHPGELSNRVQQTALPFTEVPGDPHRRDVRLIPAHPPTGEQAALSDWPSLLVLLPPDRFRQHPPSTIREVDGLAFADLGHRGGAHRGIGADHAISDPTWPMSSAVRSSSSSPILVVENISKAYSGTPVLSDLTFTAMPGDLNGCLWPAAAGKSVLVRVLTGLEQPDSGRIILRGQDVTHEAPAERNIGYVPQSFALYPHLSVRSNIYPLDLAQCGIGAREVVASAADAQDRRASRQEARPAQWWAEARGHRPRDREADRFLRSR